MSNAAKIDWTALDAEYALLRAEVDAAHASGDVDRYARACDARRAHLRKLAALAR
jgi:hypothetical protein